MTTATKTGHFSPRLFRFLRQLERNNDRAWFEKNKDRYLEHVRDPMLAFIEDFASRLRRISRHFVADPSPQGGSMFRIYRDMRFSKDKRPYKTAATARFRHEEGRASVPVPGFYIHLGADSVYAGTGIWHPDGRSLDRIRQAIVDDPRRWKRVLSPRGGDGPLQLGGASLQRPPRGFDPDHPLVEDLKRKDYVTFTELDEQTACAADFVDRYAAICRASGPFVRFLTESLGLAW